MTARPSTTACRPRERVTPPGPCSMRSHRRASRTCRRGQRHFRRQRVHGVAEEILQLGDLVGDAAIVADQMPERHPLQRQAPQTFDHRAERRLCVRRRRAAFQPGGHAQPGDIRVVRLDVVHPFRIAMPPPETCPPPVAAAGQGDIFAVEPGSDESPAVGARQRHHFRHVVAEKLAAGVDQFAEAVTTALRPGRRSGRALRTAETLRRPPSVHAPLPGRKIRPRR